MLRIDVIGLDVEVMIMKKRLSRFIAMIICMALCISFSCYIPSATLDVDAAAAGVTLTIDWNLIKKTGKQTTGTQACACFAAAYSKSIIDGKVHYWTEFNDNGGSNQNTAYCGWANHGFTLYNKETNATKVLKAAYNAINAGKPCVIYVTGNGSSGHWITLVGYKSGTSSTNPQITDFKFIDSMDPPGYAIHDMTYKFWGGPAYTLLKSGGTYKYAIPNGSGQTVNASPKWYLDSISGGTGANAGTITIAGWAYDTDKTSQSIDIWVYVGGDAPVAVTGSEKHIFTANKYRPDVNEAFGCGSYHGYGETFTTNRYGTQDVYIYAVNIGKDGNPLGTNPLIAHKTVYIQDPATVPKYTVTYNANGHGTAPSAQTILSGSKYTKPSNPTASGYTFGGWYTNSACTTAYDFNTAVTADITLYAKWTAVSTTPAPTTPTPAPTTPAPTTPAPATPATTTPAAEAIETPKLTTGIAHVQDIGDVSVAVGSDGVLTIGTTGMGKRLEQITINFENNTPYSGTLQYRVHVQNIGWMEWTDAGQKCGTEGQSLRIEAIEIRFTGELADYYSVEYCVHIQDYGDMQGWVKDGALAGTTGESKRIEELKIRIVPVNSGSSMSVKYRVHVQDYGWEGVYASNGQMSGTSGESKRLEGIEIFLDGNQYSGGVKFKTHVQDYGWQGWSYDGEMSGTQGEAKRLEGICIELYGEIADYYDIYYRVHAQDIGWMGWAKNGECAGTAGRSARLEGIQIVLVPKGEPAPGATYEGITAVTDMAFKEGF